MINASSTQIEVWVCKGCRGYGVQDHDSGQNILHGERCQYKGGPSTPDMRETFQFYSKPPERDPGNHRLVDFLYTLGRDHLPLGDLEDIMWNQMAGKEESSYCNDFLEGYARNLAERLTDPDAPLVNWKHMFLSADRKERKLGGDNPHYGS